MRLGVLDVGSNTVHLLIVDAQRGGQPVPTMSEKTELRLAELIDPDGCLSRDGADRLVATLTRAREYAEKLGVADLLAFATSAVRDAGNSAEVIERVSRESGIDLAVLPEREEAAVTFLAVRRWFGWSAGRLLVLDIGGGSLELAVGLHEAPDEALSLPLGAGRLTRDRLPGDPPRRREVTALREHVRAQITPYAGVLTAAGDADQAVGTSKTFRSLARLAGAAPYSRGPLVPRELSRAGLADVLTRIAKLPATERAGLGGVSPGRAHQLLAGAVVAEEAMDALGVGALRICPWALREGVILRRLDVLSGG